MRKIVGFWITIAWVSSLVSGQPLRINEIQVIGSHNSYHAGLGPNEMAYLRKTNPKVADALDYSHPPLTTQLNAGVRQVELDVYGDAKGGLFSQPGFPALMSQAGSPLDPPFDPSGLMLKPGFKVLHVQDLDVRSNCQPFVACLSEIRAWSQAHPRHLPIYILVENKDGRPRDYMVQPESITPDTFDRLDAEIRSVFKPDEMITPDDVRGSHKTLEESVLAGGWPTLESARGKVVFLLDQKRVTEIYTQGHPSLEGRVLFTNAKPGTPDAAFVENNDPVVGRIPALIRRGYIVRTMSDPGVEGVRSGATARRDLALASGAQMVSTDYPFDEKAASSGYSVNLPGGGIARCNPVLKPAGCKPDDLREVRK